MLENFIQTRVFVDTDEGKLQFDGNLNHFPYRWNSFFHLDATNSANKSNIEILHKRRHFLSAFCKLIVYNVIPIKHAACVIKHYVKV